MREEPGMDTDLEYIYDGTFEGFLCCIYASYVRREIPKYIYVEEGLPLLGETATWIPTEWEKAQSVYRSLSQKIGMEAQDIVRDVFLTHLPDKEMTLFRYIRLGYWMGRRILFEGNTEERESYGKVSVPQEGEDLIRLILEAYRNYRAEVKNIEGRLRFRSFPDVMISCITPRNLVLPGLADYFEKRLGDTSFLIYDKTHQMAAVHREEGTMVTRMRSLHLPVLYDEVNVYENLWKPRYENIHIDTPMNQRYALNEMRKRLWCEVMDA